MRDWLLDARTKSGMTQLEVARKIGISEAYYAYIERGERQKNMDITLAAKLSSIFEIPFERIIEFESSEQPMEVNIGEP